MTRQLEQGSVVGFVLVGFILTAALVGGIWLAKRPVHGTDNTSSSSTSSSDSANSTKVATNSSTRQTTDDELKETLSQQASRSSSNGTKSSGTDSAAATNLPSTGPGDVFVEMLGATLLTGVTVAYIRSRNTA